MKNPYGKIRYINRKHNPVIQFNTSMRREISGTPECLDKKEGFSGASPFTDKDTTLAAILIISGSPVPPKEQKNM